MFFRILQKLSKFQIGGGGKKVCLFSMKFFLEVVLGYMSFQKMFGYHTPHTYLCTESQKNQFGEILKKT